MTVIQQVEFMINFYHVGTSPTEHLAVFIVAGVIGAACLGTVGEFPAPSEGM